MRQITQLNNTYNMKNFTHKFNLLCLLIFIPVYWLHAQDTLITRHFIDVKAANRSGEVYKFKQLIAAAKEEELPEVLTHFRVARVYDIIGNVVGLPGAFIFGYSLGGAVASPNGLNKEQFFAGIGLMAFQYAIVATLRDPQMRKGIRKYNEALHQKRLRAKEASENE